MSAYCIFDNIELIDINKLNSYKQQVAEIVKKFNGQYLVLGGRQRIIEGAWTPTYLVIIEFPDYETANAWYDSPEYSDLKKLRLEGVLCNAVITEGINNNI